MNGLASLLLWGAGVGVALLVLLIGREIVTWYWKINETVTRLATIEAVLRNIDKNLILMADMAQAPKPSPQDEQKWGVGP